MARAAQSYAERRGALLEALARSGIAAQARSGFNVWVPVADEPAALRSLAAAGWAAAAGERFRLRSRPAIRLSIGSLRPEDAPGVAAAMTPAADRPLRTRTV
jgi:DNA-binding transcriptional MocR family regulator